MKDKKHHGKEIGLIIIAVLLCVVMYSNSLSNQTTTYLICTALGCTIICILIPQILSPLYTLWMKFADLLAFVITPIFMGILFFLFFTPYGIAMRLLNKDLLSLKKKESGTYWKNKDSTLNETMNKQF